MNYTSKNHHKSLFPKLFIVSYHSPKQNLSFTTYNLWLVLVFPKIAKFAEALFNFGDIFLGDNKVMKLGFDN